jgi:hypothetical protein
MISTVFDATTNFQAGGTSLQNIDLSGWDYCVVQLVGPSGSINFLSSNDDGSITGSVQGGPLTSANFTAVQGVNLATGAAATSGGVAGLWKFSGIGRFLQLSGTGITATKILVYLSKIH